MTVLSAQSIHRRPGLITPFFLNKIVHESGMSYGLSHAGYDVRIAEDVYLYAGRCVLASTLEHFDMPTDLLAYVKDKSTLARQGVAVQNTVIEPGWKGYLTLELTYSPLFPGSDVPGMRIDAGTPIAQIVFHKLDQPTDNPYFGKYQNQAAGPQPAILEGRDV